MEIIRDSNLAIGRERPDRPVVCFIGNAMNFSVSVLRVAEIEFPELKFARLGSVEELSKLFDVEPLAMFVDETLLSVLLDSFGSLSLRYPKTRIALAYRNVQTGQKLLTEQFKNTDLDEIDFLPMNMQFDSWISVLRLILAGGAYLPRELLTAGMMKPDYCLGDACPFTAADQGSSVEVNLTGRETEVLSLVAEGKQNKTIADDLDLSQHTVKLHIHHIIVKLGVHNRTEAAAWFLSHPKSQIPIPPK